MTEFNKPSPALFISTLDSSKEFIALNKDAPVIASFKGEFSALDLICGYVQPIGLFPSGWICKYVFNWIVDEKPAGTIIEPFQYSEHLQSNRQKAAESAINRLIEVIKLQTHKPTQKEAIKDLKAFIKDLANMDKPDAKKELEKVSETISKEDVENAKKAASDKMKQMLVDAVKEQKKPATKKVGKDSE